MRRACFRSRRADQGALTTTDSSDVQECRSLFPADIPRLCAPAASDRLAPKRNATRPAARQRRRRDAENVYGGEVSFRSLPLASNHSITSSARASSDGGTSRPSAFAVLRLITSSNRLGRSIG